MNSVNDTTVMVSNGTLDDRLADWWDTTTWEDVLDGADGKWTPAGRDECGCPVWTRPHAPGEHVTRKSLTAHEEGCSRGRTDGQHPAAHVWSDHAPDALLEMAARRGRTLSAFSVYTALQHEGDFSASAKAAGIPPELVQDLTEQGTNFDDGELWCAEPWLERVRDTARLLGVNRYALLIAILSEVSLQVPPSYVMDNPRPVSLNMFVLLVGNPGGGKGVTLDHAQTAVGRRSGNQFAAGIEPPRTVKGFTGEGAARAFEVARPDGDDDSPGDRPAAPSGRPLALRFREDEVSGLTAKAGDSRSTHYAVLNAAFMGEDLGATLADSRRSFYVPAQSYRMCLQVAGQPSTVGDLFTGQAEGSGFTARLLVADMRIDADDVDAVDPGQVDTSTATVVVSTAGIGYDDMPGGLKAIRTDPAIVAELNRARVMRNVKGADSADEDGHAGLLRRKVATLLAIASGAETVDYRYWRLAGFVVDNSRHTVAQWRVDTEKNAHAAAVRRVAADRRVDREAKYLDPEVMATKVADWYTRKYPNGEPAKFSEAYRSPLKNCKEVRDEVRDLLAAGHDPRVTVEQTEKGYAIRPAG